MGAPTKENTYNVTLEYWEDGKWIAGRLREYPGVISQGKNMDELISNINDALRQMETSMWHRKRTGISRKYKTKRLELAA